MDGGLFWIAIEILVFCVDFYINLASMGKFGFRNRYLYSGIAFVFLMLKPILRVVRSILRIVYYYKKNYVTTLSDTY